MSYKGQKLNHRPSSAGRRVLPAELGLAGQRVLTLPSHVDTCDQGENCCWRWLAHSVMKEASWLKEDLDAVRKEHGEHVESHIKAEHDVAAFAELRGAHGALQQELGEYRHDCADLRRELMTLKAAHGQKVAREQELQRDVARLEEEKKESLAREAELRSAAETAQMELRALRSAHEDTNRELRSMGDWKITAEMDLRRMASERDELRKAAEAAQKGRGKGKRTGIARSASGRRTNSAGRGYQYRR